MTGYGVTVRLGRIATGENDALFTPRTARTGRRGAILLHGAGGSAGTFVDGNSTVLPLAATLAGNGVACIAIDAAGDAFANDTSMSRITAAWSQLQADTGCASDKVCLYGISMGAGTAMRYAMLNPTKVAAVYGTAPMSDINDIYQNNRGGYRAAIGTAWSVTYPTALPAGADLSGQASAAAAIPCQLDYGSADTTIQPSTVTTLAAAWGARCTATVVDSTNNHGDTLFGKTSPAAVYALFVANGA